MASNRLYGPSGAPGTAGALALNTPGATAGVLPATQVVAVTTETTILNPSLASATAALVLIVPANSPLEAKPFTLEASGVLETAQSSTVTLKLYEQSSATLVSGNLMGSSGAISAFSGKCPWYIRATLIFDSISGKLTGQISFFVNNTIVAAVAISNVPTSINNTNNPVLNFVLSVQFGTATAPNTIVVEDFAINF